MTPRVLCVCVRAGLEAAYGAQARRLAGDAGQVAILSAETEPSDPGPVDRVYQVMDPSFDRGRGDHWAAAISAATRSFEPSLVLTGPTKVELEALARAAGALGAPVVTRGRAVRITESGVQAERDLLSGNAVGTESASGPVVFLALAEEPSVGTEAVGSQTAAERISLPVELPAYAYRRVSLRPKPPQELDLEGAERIVSVGRGLQRKEDLALVEQLATVLGAAVGCTRPIAAESGWLSDEHWVGLTGHRVRPFLYLAVGISGAAQHLVGMRDSKLVVAINKDPNAPIFQQADFQVVGDLYAILPELTRQLAAARASR